VADRSLVEQRRQEFNFFRKTLVGFRRNDLIFDIGANRGLKAEIFLKLGAVSSLSIPTCRIRRR
jgi:hypothetical protein